MSAAAHIATIVALSVLSGMVLGFLVGRLFGTREYVTVRASEWPTSDEAFVEGTFTPIGHLTEDRLHNILTAQYGLSPLTVRR